MPSPDMHKHLNCLYAVSTLIAAPGASLDATAQGVVELLPGACQYPEYAVACIVLNGQEFRTPNFAETRWTLSSPIIADDCPAGHITVAYLAELPPADVGPFTRHERRLLDAVAERMGLVVARARAQEQIIADGERFRGLVERSNDGIILADEEGNLTHWNAGMERITGLVRADVIGRKLWDVHFSVQPIGLRTPERQKFLTDVILCLLDSGELPAGVQSESEMVHADGTPRIVQGGTFAVRTPRGYMVCGIFRDVTRRRETEKKLAAHRELLEQAVNKRTAELEQEIARRKQVERMLSERVQELGMLNKIGGLAVATLDIDRVVEAGLDGIVASFGVDVAMLFLWKDNALHFRHLRARTPGLEYSGPQVKQLGQCLCGIAAQQRQPLYSSDICNDWRCTLPECKDAHMVSCAALPLLSGSDLIGILLVGSAKPRDFTEHSTFLQALAAGVAVGLQNSLLHERQREHAAAEHAQRELADTLREVGEMLTSTLDYQTVLNNILFQVERLIPHDATNIMFLESGIARIVAWRGYDRFGVADLSGVALDTEQSPVFQEMFDTGKPVVFPDVQTTPGWVTLPESAWVRSYASAPIRLRQRVIGCLNVDSATPNFFTPAHLARLQILANQAAVALHNAELYEKAHNAAESMQALSHRLVQMQEMERSRLAREFHDEIGQALTSQMVDLHYIEQHAAEPERVMARTAELKQSTNRVLEDVHRLTVNLRPVTLDHLGLVAALKQQVDDFGAQHPEMEVEFEALGIGEQRSSTETETALYRITQESLTNVARHARATKLQVLLQRRGEKLVLTVWDNGAGFDFKASLPSNRLGLTSMRERALMLGGALWVESAVGAGTTVHVEVPDGGGKAANSNS